MGFFGVPREHPSALERKLNILGFHDVAGCSGPEETLVSGIRDSPRKIRMRQWRW